MYTYMYVYVYTYTYKSCQNTCDKRHFCIFHPSGPGHIEVNTGICIPFIHRELVNLLDNTLHATELSSA